MIADVCKHRSIKRNARGPRGHRNPGQCHQRQQSRGFENDRLAAGIRAGDHHRVLLVVKRKRNGNHFAATRTQVLFEQRMARVDQLQLDHSKWLLRRGVDLGNHAVERW